MARVILYAIVFFLIYYFLKALLSLTKMWGKDYASRVKTSGDIEGIQDMVKDPQCKTYIPIAGSLKKKIDNKIYYFCSEECLKKFSKTKGKSYSKYLPFIGKKSL